MGAPQYYQYLLNQVQGCLSAPASGFTLWNASNRYYMVPAALKSMLLQGSRPASLEAAPSPAPAAASEQGAPILD